MAVHPYAITNTAGPPANMFANITTQQTVRVDKYGMTES
jgi:hypothetical protein